MNDAPVLSVTSLCKTYPGFSLDRVSFEMQPGAILGLVGRNGAGKTTLLKSLLHMVHPNSGAIQILGLPFPEREWEIKQHIGFVSGSFPYYEMKPLSVITDTVRRFYPAWDDARYRALTAQFDLPLQKTPRALSSGMRVKYALTLALSHGARLLLLDEPTSGLDPVSRSELLDIFLDLSRAGISILFSTHITSDLEACADQIVYLRNGRVLLDEKRDALLASHRLVHLSETQYAAWQAEKAPLLIGCKRSKTGFSGLVKAEHADALSVPTSAATLDDIIIHLEQEASHETASA